MSIPVPLQAHHCLNLSYASYSSCNRQAAATSEQLTKRFKSLKTFELAKHPLVVAGVRGYYKNAMGAPGVNDRGIYDDAIFVYTPSVMAAFNGNADFCEDLSDVVYGLIRRNFCNDCYEALPNDALKAAIQQLLSWRYQPAKG